MGVDTVVTVAKLGWLTGGNLTPPTVGRVGWALKAGPLFIIPGTEGEKIKRRAIITDIT